MKKSADILVYNCRLYTLDTAGTRAEAMAIRDGKILETGFTEDLLSRFTAGERVDCHGLAVFPGFIDAHCHFHGLALGLRWIDLVGCTSFPEVIARIEEADTLDDGSWITGRGWDQNLWPVKEFPSRKELDDRWPNRPVVLIRIDGHVALANRTALDRAGIGTSHNFPDGEVDLRDGDLTGILRETAADHIRNAIPKPTPDETLELLKEAEALCFSYGLTGVSDAGLENSILHLLDSALHKGQLKIPIYAMMEPSRDNLTEYIATGPVRRGRFHLCSIKLYADGSLGSRTALLSQPYSDDPSTNGIQVSSPRSVREVCRLAYDHHFQVNVHCIGDRAVKEVLEVFGEVLQGENDRRWRIEHAQVVDPADLILFRKYRVIPSVQATHATSDMKWAGARLGPVRIGWAYAYKTLMDQNGWLANGTDFPIERVNPMLTFFAAVSRTDVTGYPPGGFQPENALTREEALRSMTIWAAKANFDEHEYGSLEPGKWANFVLLDRDIMEIPLPDVPEVRVLGTWIHGDRVYTKD